MEVPDTCILCFRPAVPRCDGVLDGESTIYLHRTPRPSESCSTVVPSTQLRQDDASSSALSNTTPDLMLLGLFQVLRASVCHWRAWRLKIACSKC